MKRLAVIWCELDSEQGGINFSRELAHALKEYAELVLDSKAGQRHECENFSAENGVLLKVISAIWNGELAPHEACPHCLKYERSANRSVLRIEAPASADIQESPLK